MDRIGRVGLAIVLAAMVGGAVLGAGRVGAQDGGDGGLITVCGSTGRGDDVGPISITREQYDAYVAEAGFPPLTPDAERHCTFSIYAPTPASTGTSAAEAATNVVQTADPGASSGTRPVVLPNTGVGSASHR
jgi:hypothetical protein